MAKEKTVFVCQSCGAVAARWQGKCPDCGEWNTIVEERQVPTGPNTRPAIAPDSTPLPITNETIAIPPALPTTIGEFDRVLGGGLVPGSLTLVGGEPGIGKSTLMLQAAHRVARNHGDVLYVSGEESFQQTRMRAERLGAVHDRLLLLTETNIEAISRHFEKGDYAFVIIDSIQSVYSAQLNSVPGSVGQVRECANEFLRLSKGSGVPFLLVGHVTKDGSIAGPRTLEHLVDTVLYFEGEGKQVLRILRGFKNRFGSTNEIGVFEMTGTGLDEVPNPSALFLQERPKGTSGSVVFPSIEGTRPVLVEVQALVTDSNLSSPRRTVSGVNSNRLALVLAVLEKRADLRLSDKDVFVNVAGGVRLDEPAADLAIALALASSLHDRPVPDDLLVFGELGLAGEVRAVNMARPRIAEGSKFGFKMCILPPGCVSDAQTPSMRLLGASGIAAALEYAL